MDKTEYRDWLTHLFGTKEPNEKHSLIVRTAFPYILTTNYDFLLEKAAKQHGFFDLAKNSFSFKDADKIATRFLHKKPAIVHVHGTYGSIESDELIFTAEDYRKLIKNKYEAFSFCLRMFFFHYSCLFIGYGASDPHLEDIVEEIATLYSTDEEDLRLRDSFLVLRRERSDDVLDRYKEQMRTHLVLIEKHEQTTELLRHLLMTKPRECELDFAAPAVEQADQDSFKY